jgi:hypothetical protein
MGMFLQTVRVRHIANKLLKAEFTRMKEKKQTAGS